MARLIRGKKWPSALVALAVGLIVVWQWGLRSQVLSYGNPAKSYFNPAQGAPGETVKVCFDDLVWSRLCQSDLVQHFTPANMASGNCKRVDSVYRISTPVRRGRVPPKCRDFKIPEMDEVCVGPATLQGYVRSECWPWDHWSPLITPMPTLKITTR